MKPLPDELQKAKAFHSHLGPYLVVGLKMGRAVTERLGDHPFSMAIEVFTGPHPPLSCVADGLQLSTPCTVGNGGIRIREGDQARIRALRGEQQIELSLKSEIWAQIKAAVGTDRLEELAVKLWGMDEGQLFDVSSV